MNRGGRQSWGVGAGLGAPGVHVRDPRGVSYPVRGRSRRGQRAVKGVRRSSDGTYGDGLRRRARVAADGAVPALGGPGAVHSRGRGTPRRPRPALAPGVARWCDSSVRGSCSVTTCKILFSYYV